MKRCQIKGCEAAVYMGNGHHCANGHLQLRNGEPVVTFSVPSLAESEVVVVRDSPQGREVKRLGKLKVVEPEPYTRQECLLAGVINRWVDNEDKALEIAAASLAELRNDGGLSGQLVSLLANAESWTVHSGMHSKLAEDILDLLFGDAE